MNKRFLHMLEPRFRLCFIMLIVFALSSFFIYPWLAAVELIIVLLVYLQFRHTVGKRNREVVSYVENMMYNVDVATKDSILNFPFPMVIVKPDSDEIIWCNNAFMTVTDLHERVFETHLADTLPQFSLNWLYEGKNEAPEDIVINGRNFTALGNLVRPEFEKGGELLATIYFVENSELRETQNELNDTRQIVSILMIDNFDELLSGVDDSGRNAVLAAIDEKIAKWIEPAHGITIKSERDRYIFIFQNKYFDKYRAERFNLLDSVREVVSPRGIHATLSIGIGKDGASFYDNYKSAQLAIEMSLSRGGDQAVIRNALQFEFYGGKTEGLEKRTKVKARVMSNAIVELIKDASNVFVMGHQNADNDSVGAATGILAIARHLGKRGNIVLRTRENSAEQLCNMLVSNEQYADVFITPEDAIVEADKNTLLVIVDTNSPKYVESTSLLESVSKIAVVDHHRRGAEYIDNALLSFHEPYASSASELVTELSQYVLDPHDMLSCEAEALLAGMVLDTKNFTMKTGVRTFEAAAFLRRAGADTVNVKRLLQNDLDSYVNRAQIVKCAKIYRKSIAIAAYAEASDRVTAAQAADELLSITRVQASFVLYEDNGCVYISARSLGNINVQVILEKLGGGGHLANAGAQVRDKDLNEVLNELKAAIDSVVPEE